MATLPNLIEITDLRPLTPDETKVFIGLAIAGLSSDESGLDAPQPLSYFDDKLDGMPFPLRVLLIKLEHTGLNYSPAAILFLGLISGTPGEAVMWAYTLFRASRDGNPLTLVGLTGEPDSPFAMGVPTEKALHAAWDAQKEPGAPLGNALDRADTWMVDAQPA